MPVTRRHRPGLALALLCIAQVVDVMSVTVAVVALPSIRRDLGFGEADVQWVVSAYALTFAGFLVVGGRAADLYGRRRLFMAGLALFAAGSLGCGVAPSPVALVAARCVQGLGAAVGVPAALSLLTATFPEPRDRARALGWWTAAAAGGGAGGLVVGGLVTQAAGWEWAFLLSAPIALVVLVLTPLVLREVETPGGARLDVAGAVTVTAGLVLVVFALSAAGRHGVLSGLVLGAFALGALLLVAFTRIERRVPAPVAPPRLVGMRPVAVACLAAALLTGVTSPGGVLATVYLQEGRGLDAGEAGLVLLPFSLAVIAGSAAGSWLVPRVAVRVSLGAGLTAIAAAMGLAATVGPGTEPALLAAALALAGAGLGLASVAATALGVSEVPSEDEGVTSGLLNTAAQVGTAVGIAALLGVAAAGDGAGAAAVIDGVRTGYVVAAALAAAGAVGVTVLLRRPAVASAA